MVVSVMMMVGTWVLEHVLEAVEVFPVRVGSFRTNVTSRQLSSSECWSRHAGIPDQPFNDKQRWIELRIGSSDTRFVLLMFDDGLKPGIVLEIDDHASR
jgi:hypothetical protein